MPKQMRPVSEYYLGIMDVLKPKKGQPNRLCILYDHDLVFSRIHRSAERMFHTFFKSGREMRIICIRTADLSLDRLSTYLVQSHKIERSAWVSNIAVPFLIQSKELAKFVRNLNRSRGPFKLPKIGGGVTD